MNDQERYLYGMAVRENIINEGLNRQRVLTLEEEIEALKKELAEKEAELKKRESEDTPSE